MSRQLAAGLTVIFLLALLASNPSLSGIPIYGDTSLLEFWVKNIALAMPPAFTLGMCTVLLYKGFRYPRGTFFTILAKKQRFKNQYESKKQQKKHYFTMRI